MRNHHTTFSATAFVLALFLFCGATVAQAEMPTFEPASVPAVPDYTNDTGWLSIPKSNDHPVDIFWVYPTVLFDKANWLMPLDSKPLVAAAKDTLRTQASVFSGQANLYAPLYRQMNIAALALPEAQEEAIYTYTKKDVRTAFKYYLEHYNNGRPFILAGHSQGSKIIMDMAVDLWGTLGVEDKLVAAYIIGWATTTDDLAKNPNLAICETAQQTGCFINYNTMAPGKQSVAPTLNKEAIVVNPLSWTTSKDVAPASKNRGAVFFKDDGTTETIPHYTNAQIIEAGLVIDPEDTAILQREGGAFPKGVYHFFDYSIFYENLRHNAGERIQSILNK